MSETCPSVKRLPGLVHEGAKDGAESLSNEGCKKSVECTAGSSKMEKTRHAAILTMLIPGFFARSVAASPGEKIESCCVQLMCLFSVLYSRQ